MAARPPRTFLFLVLLCLFAIASTVLGRSFTALAPGEHDAQLFAYLGSMWFDGYVPYRDIWDNKPPGIFLVSGIAFSLTPYGFLALAAVEGIFILGCIATVYAIMRQLGAPVLSVFVATAGCAAMSNLASFNDGGNLTEIYVLWPAALSMLAFLKALPQLRAGPLLLAGLFSGLATGFKLVGIAPLLAQLSFLLTVSIIGGWKLRSVLSAAFLTVSGFMLAWIPWLIYFALNGSGLELLKVSFYYPLLYGVDNQPGLLRTASIFVNQLLPVASLVTAGIAGAVLLSPYFYRVLKASRSQADAATHASSMTGWAAGLVGLWLLFDILGALAGGRGYGHYFLPLSASLTVMAGMAHWLLVRPTAPGGGRISAARILVACVILVSPVFGQLSDLGDVVRLVRDPGAHVNADEGAVIDYVNRNKTEGTTLFSWDYRPRLFFETGLVSPHRLTSSVNLGDSRRFRTAVGDELMTTLERDSPTFVADDRKDSVSTELRRFYARFRALVDSRYELVATEGDLRLYRRRPSESETGRPD